MTTWKQVLKNSLTQSQKKICTKCLGQWQQRKVCFLYYSESTKERIVSPPPCLPLPSSSTCPLMRFFSLFEDFWVKLICDSLLNQYSSFSSKLFHTKQLWISKHKCIFFMLKRSQEWKTEGQRAREKGRKRERGKKQRLNWCVCTAKHKNILYIGEQMNGADSATQLGDILLDIRPEVCIGLAKMSKLENKKLWSHLLFHNCVS